MLKILYYCYINSSEEQSLLISIYFHNSITNNKNYLGKSSKMKFKNNFTTIAMLVTIVFLVIGCASFKNTGDVNITNPQINNN